ncbi:MAG: S8 family serine peptidase, partial [candidate division Zixibacteria bacterium]|nr:S8 family serine peptidase [candidate division Zixibacteria bacterium]
MGEKMKNTILISFILSICITAFGVAYSQAAEVHSLVTDKISSGQDYVKVIIRLSDRLSKNELENRLSLASYTRQAAHSLAVTSLKQHARQSQARLLDYLNGHSQGDGVRFVKSYWLDNVIRAEVRSDLVDELAEFGEIEKIYPDLPVSIIEPVEDFQPISKKATGAGENLRVIGADSLWKLGYTGEGTLLASFDTGVEGDHPALLSNYRGNRYPHQQCWFNPVLNDTFPHIFDTSYISSSSIRSHGTAVLGAVVGKDDATGDTIGAAFGAEWIAAGVTDIKDQNFILDALQWGADPDGDPNTSEDVPDVLSNSWGYTKNYAGCMDIFDGFISNLEALGVVVVYAAGNKGPTFRSLANPAIRVLSEYTVFSVGMINSDYDSLRVDNSSSRGPSDCDETAIKPHVVAPGRNVPLTFPLEVYPDAGGYGTGTGTSFACPHVAAAALLLRQVNPNAPVDSIKKALMYSAIDIEEPGPDSTSGYGVIYLPEAMKLLPANDQPNLYVKSVTGPSINAGDTASIEVELTNSGLGILGVSAVVRARGGDAVVLDSSADYGAIALNDSTSNSGQPYRIAFDDSISAGRMVVFDLVLNGSGGYQDT